MTNIDRRTLLKAMGATSLTPLVIGGSANRAAAEAAELKPTSTEAVYFRGWPFKPEVVADNVNRYNSEQGGHVDYQTVTHGDYPTLMEKSLIAGDKLDIIYGNPPTAVRFLEAGWIAPADDVPNIAQIKADMYDNARNAFTYKDKLLGLSYFLAVRGLVVVNTDKQKEFGVDGAQPKNWDEFYAQVLDLAKKGGKDLYMPHWFNEFYGISWAFIWEVINRGGAQIDPKTFAPQLTVDGAGGKTLTAWKAIYNAGLVKEEVLSFNEAAIVDAFSSGRYLYSTQASYNLAVFNDPTKSKVAGKTRFLPYQGQSWGLLDSAMYIKSARKRPAALDVDVARFQSWYGYKDQTGKVAVGQRWAENSMLFSAYKTVMESETTKAAFKKNLVAEGDFDALLAVYSKAPHPDTWKTIYAEEYNTYLRNRLGQFLRNDESVEKVIGEINAQIASLNKKYKLG